MPPKERKIKPPDDPTIMVDGVPKLSINANKLQIAEYLKINKAIHNRKVGIYGYRQGPSGPLRKTSKQLRDELIAGGHMVGELTEQAKKNPGRKGGASKPANIAAKIAEDKQIAEIKLNGWTPVSTTAPAPTPAPDPAVINMSGYGGIPIDLAPTTTAEAEAPQKFYVGSMRDYLSTRIANPISYLILSKKELIKLYLIEKAKEGEFPSEPAPAPAPEPEPDKPKLKVGPMRDYLNTRIARTAYNGLNKKELTELYLKEKEKQNNEGAEESAEEEAAPEPDKPKIKVGPMRDYLSTRIANTAFKDLNKKELTELYWEKQEEENNELAEESEEEPQVTLPAAVAETVEDVEFPESDGWDTVEPEPAPDVSDDDSGDSETSDDYDSDDDLVEDTSVTQPFSHEGIDYHVGFDYVKMYKDAGGKILVGTLNEDMDEILWKNAAFEAEHEARRAEYIRNSQ